MNILLADDHDLVRDGITSFLKTAAPEVEIAQAKDFAEALSIVDGDTPVELTILDLNMPGMNGLSGLTVMRQKHPEIPVVILSGSVKRSDVLNALEHGASGYLPKTLSGKSLINALRLIMSGEKYIPSALLEDDGSNTRPGEIDLDGLAPDNPLRQLTNREREVLALLTKGLSNKEIAKQLTVREITVKVHLTGIFKKLGAANRTQAVKIAMQLGWEA
ncbi:two-component system nitrate/nitrite response regulator NarL [Thalassospira sp. MBR-102]|jgi:DNA-binding NarL/FixJ family response regulator|uniref:LuxR family transcriptional regulator n=5 Tax=Thalassospira TaxID=168934 RepID=A0A367WCL3_9PROT|nr:MULTISPECIES: response regulator transcription factor [Thalassospira]MBR9778231.1 response regulator transcription factor [Rhodospirillales bacterium]AJD53159.1 HTH-type LuxR family transcriptional regulator [Thalassospira xiamenensis M-5 = DSM 17429]KEO56963.1 LuxR family transcriptional regulator [Thalassospira permensis NBRC 106175]KZB57457.1 LuxR family transcriptional regulator [Thalassospira xiamenensis]KZD03999.1 LuxR family transcriptional regulator [Thalassospira xiamenensis]|tara:strand:- start:1810 stop:2463 length:654 start_codon:yes stop_codon:yes gene_type:complete|eukprot:TRINITY_DN5013_c0_g1_i2.p2 TRINITY_DN5013_c0_g1~~TRINITY_DN5013_c0_g1_i2.p2  ORF type:complete len:218 (+),score=55.08 TRINITY_DN5013_c0_g1_i2:1044-1697(+)